MVGEGASVGLKLTFEGMAKNTEQMANMMTSMARLVKTTIVGVGIWGGLEPLLRPVLQMLKLLLTVLFLPMMPLIKTILTNMAKTASKVAEAQKEAGGEGLGAFMAGVGALLSEPSIWGIVGALIAASFLSTLALGALAKLSPIFQALSGIILITWGIKSAWDTMATPGIQWSEVAQSALFTGIGLRFLGMSGMAAARFAGWVGLILIAFEFIKNPADVGKFVAGLTNFLVGLFDKFNAVMDAMNPIAWFTNWMSGKPLLGDLSFFSKWGDEFLTGYYTELDKLKTSGKLTKSLGALLGEGFSFDSDGNSVKDITNGLDNTIGRVQTLNTTMVNTFNTTAPLLKSFNMSVAGNPDSLDSNLTITSTNWTSMANNSKIQIQGIITELNQIPREIVTVHRIVTVTSSSKK